MPGIVGLFSLDPQAVTARDAMLRWMTQGRDDPFAGTHSDPEHGVHVGWAGPPGTAWSGRIAWNTARDTGLVFAGEAFFEDGAVDDSTGAPPPPGGGDAERLVKAYEQLGQSFFDRLNGCFCGVLLDLRHGRTHLFNDRYGLGRIYLRRRGNEMYFSTDVGSILEADSSARGFDAEGVAEFYTIGCPLANRTLFKGIEQLPPSSVCTFWPDGRWQASTYFNPQTWEQQEPLAHDAFQRELTATFSALLPTYLGPSGSAAMSLTGGLDGRMIMAWARARPGALPCYSFASTYRECEDVRIARQVAQACKQPFQTFVVGDEFLRSFPQLAIESVRISGGAMDVTGASELYVNRLARAVSPVRITGNYGSEILRGAIAFRPRHMAENYCSEGLRASLRRAEATYAAERDVADLTFIAFRQVPWHHHSRLSVERSQLTVRSPYLDDRLVRLMYRAPAAAVASKRPCLKLIHSGMHELASIRTDRGFRHRSASLLDRLEQQWLEFTFKAEYAYDYGMPQWLTRIDCAASSLRAERLFLGRHKFQHYRIWYRRELAGFVRDVLHAPSPMLLEFFDREALAKMADDHVNGSANNTMEIHRALTLELVARELLHARSSRTS